MPASALRSVLVPTDFSKGAQAAFDRALTLPLDTKACITALHVVHPDIPGSLRKQALAEAERSLEKAIARARTRAVGLGLGGLRFTGEVSEGAAPKEIARFTRRTDADLVCLGRHGKQPVVDFFLGTVAQKVSRQSEAPLLVVQRDDAAPWNRPLIALGLGNAATGVVKGARQVLPADAEPILLHASALPFEDSVSLSADELEALRQSFSTSSRKTLEAVVKRSGFDGARIDVRLGDPRSTILAEADRLRAELIVLGTHARRGLERVLLGSVAEWVLARAAVDVLLVRS